MTTLQDWSTITLSALQKTWDIFLTFLPKLFGAAIIFIIGWFFALGIGRLVAEFLKRLKFNQIFERTGWKEALEKAELKVNPSEFVGAIFKWILVIVFLLAAVDILELRQFSIVLSNLIAWLPNLIVAVAIFVVAVIVTDIIEKLIRASVKKMEIGYAGFLGTATRWSIYTFAGLAILLQLGVTPTIIDTLITGFVGMLALAFGLAFGLGGRDAASRFIADVQKKISEK